jgi:hypothetical protein
MKPIRITTWLFLAALVSLGCPSDPPSPPEPVAKAAAAVAPANPEPAAAAEPPPAEEPAEPAAKPECSAPADCSVKGKPAKGMAWACTDGKCAEAKVSKGKKKGR